MGYMHINLKSEGRRRFAPLHRLILEAWTAPQPTEVHACHNDGDKLNNHLDNLRWDTPRGNNEDKRKHGTWQWGEKHGCARLTEDQVRSVAGRYESGERVDQIADSFGISTAMIREILKGTAWAAIGRTSMEGRLHRRKANALTIEQVIQIKQRIGTMSDRALGRQFGVTGGAIGKIRKGKAWKHAVA